MTRRLAWGAGAAVALAQLGCSSEDVDPAAGGAAMAIYTVPGSLDALADEAFLDHPMPSDFRRDDAGAPVFSGFHNPLGKPLIEEYVGATAGLFDGFSPVATGYLRFTGALDPATLPQTPDAALAADASVQLIDIDPASPNHGERRLLTLSFRTMGGAFVLPNTLRFKPSYGFPLRVSTRYALVVTTDALAADGSAVQPSAELREVLGLEPASGPRAAHADAMSPALDELAAAGIAADRIAHLAVFTTGDPTAETIAVRDHLRANVAAPTFVPGADWGVFQQNGYVEYRSEYGPSPNYQAGTSPYKVYGDGGAFNFVNGSPEVVDTFDARFSLTVPDSAGCVMPTAGYPIVLYAHGTGGSYRSHISYASTLADKCIASMGVDQILHGTRPGAPSDTQEIQLLFFNFQNVDAARTNGRQSAIDEVQRARLFTESNVVVPASESTTGQDILFDPSKVMFMGHSQGGLNGPLYLAVDDSARGGVLSGSGAVIEITLLEKTEPAPSIANLVRTVFLGLTTEQYEELDVFHPALSLAQILVDAIDPINYAHFTAREPRDGFAPKSVLMTEGIAPDGSGDSYTPPKGTEAQAIAMGLPLQLPAQLPYEQLEYGAESVEIPAEGLSGNLAGGQASGVLAQWPPADGKDGHFVVFDIDAARAQAAEFLWRLSEDPVGSVPAP
jgi:hypothetical protein